MPLGLLELGSAKKISNSSITVALPLTEKSVQILEVTITDLLGYPSAIKGIVVLCPETLLSTARPMLVVSSPQGSGLQGVNKAARSLLLNPPAVTLPPGLKGFALPTPEAQEGHAPLYWRFIVPRIFLFLLSFCQASSSLMEMPLRSTVQAHGAPRRFISDRRPDTISGIVVSRDLAGDGCYESLLEVQDATNSRRILTLPIDDYASHIFDPELLFSNASTHKSLGHFGLFFPTLDDLVAFSLGHTAWPSKDIV
ncbi:hypothetical protein BJV78DRAFT_1279070 [Lactifluus subvellereus]|nr:hypothetical protein BJV78DRAFT_1279070 [Lactifluus subvellereus]